MTTEIREERRVITALFADLVGSTALGERLDPEEVKLVIGDAIARIVAVIEESGGHVKDLAGDGVLAFFGAPVAAEDDAERAARAALRIVDEVVAYSVEVARAWDVEGLGVRVGLATGPVVVGLVGGGGRTEYAAFGDTVNVAARLQSAAEPGTVLTDAETRRVLEASFSFGDLHELELKGKAEPVAAAALAQPRGDRAPQRGIRGMESHVVGRERELESGRDAIGALKHGTGGILFVTGEPGIGKSRLLMELRAEFEAAHGSGRAQRWLDGRCVSYGESIPYWPFREVIRALLGVEREAPELRVRLGLRRALDRLFGERQDELYSYLASLLDLSVDRDAGARLVGVSPEALQYRTFEVAELLFERLAEEGPLVIALEDLHWADPTSLQLVERLFALPERAAVMLIVSQRNEPDHSSWMLRERAGREFPHLTTELSLQPLSGDAQAELLAGLLGGATLPDDLADRLLVQAEGNPFYLEELIRSLVDAGALVRAKTEWIFTGDATIDLPPTVEKVILARLDRLPREAHDVITSAAALGRRFSLPLLEGIVGDGDTVRNALHELQRLDLVRGARRWPEPEYRFKHALIQETAYRTLVRARRMELHRRAAEWVEGHYPADDRDALGLLAHHWLAARDNDKAIEYSIRAGDRARAEHAIDEAIGHYRALLPLLEERGERRRMALVLFKLALALHTTLRFGEANTIYQQAFGLWDELVAPKEEANLHVAADVIGRELDPAKSYAPQDMQLQMAVMDRLVERWPEAAIVPSLAERWDIAPDGLRYVFHLREGLRWSDGRPLTAADVEYGVMRTLSPTRPGVSVAVYYVLEAAQDYVRGIGDASSVGVHALDDRTVEFRLAAPAPYFLSVVNRPDAAPQPRHAIEEHGDAWTNPEHHVVSGAFRQASRTDDTTVLERRADALPRAGNVARVELRQRRLRDVLDEREQRRFELITVSPATASASDVEIVADEVALGPPAWTFYLVFDHGHPLLGRPEVRRALAQALDRDAIPYGRNFLPAYGGIVPPALLGHTPEIAPRFDPDGARASLAEIDTSVGFDVAVTNGDQVGRMMQAVVASWTNVIDVPIRVRAVDEPFAAVRMRMLDFADAAPSSWFPGYPDPEYYLRLLLHSAAVDNRGRWNHAQFDDLIERSRRETDGRRRLQLFHDADRMAIAEECAVIPFAYARNAFLTDPALDGWWEFGKSWASYADLRLDARKITP